MIIICINCKKKFEIESNLIPDIGRLLQCNGCDHKWFFKKNLKIGTVSADKINELQEQLEPVHKKLEPTREKLEPVNQVIEPPETAGEETIKLLDKSINNSSELENFSIKNEDRKNDNKVLKNTLSKNKNNYNILGLIIVFIISFIALIIILDTFQLPISNIVPNIEFLLYNLYESIKDIFLFLNNLI